MTVTPINMAEAITDPFWDGQLSTLPQWRITPGEAHGLRVGQNWCWVNFDWARRPAAGPALRMSRAYDLDCSGYDKLLLSAMPPLQSVVRIIARTDRGERRFQSPPVGAAKQEFELDLQGASRLTELTIEIDAALDGVALGWFNWIGLQNSAQLARFKAQYARFDARWDKYLKPESFEPAFTPTMGLLMDAAELDALRRRHDEFLRARGQTPFTLAATKAAAIAPETRIGDFVNFWNDTRYCRARDHGRELLTHGPAAAVAGLLLKDKSLLRLAARFAMSIAMCDHWDDGMICYFPGGNFDHRCFVQSLCTMEAALVLDLAGEYFTDAGREFILRRIGDEGLGSIHYNVWKYDYIFHCNQLAWFSPGRVLGLAAMEKHWPRVKPYTDLAHSDLVESLNDAILPDGGYVEGPTYFTCVGYSGGASLYYYGRARGRTLADLLPEPMRKTADFAALTASTDEEQDSIPICDAGPATAQESLAVMASALPQSQWTAMYRKSLARTGMPQTVLACKLDAEIPAAAPPPPCFVQLPVMGALASTRKLGREWVKILVMGNKAGAGHTHEDKGSFVLEYAGQTFAMDPGTTDYSSPLAGLLQKCERHNMLVPTGIAQRPAPQCPLHADIKPDAWGDEQQFRAQADLAPGWEPYYRRWNRSWESPDPATLIIRDDYELASGTGVEFYWHTLRDVAIDGRLITLTGRRGKVILTAPADCTIRLDELPYIDGSIQHRIALVHPQTSGRIEVHVKFLPA